MLSDFCAESGEGGYEEMDTAGVVLTQEISGAPYPLRALDVPVHAFALLKGNLLASFTRYTIDKTRRKI